MINNNTSEKIMVTVLMPVFNGARYLKNSIGSLLCQTFKKWELLVVDDGSTDTSWTILQQFAAKDARIRLYSKQNDKNGNVAANMKWLCEQGVNGDYCFYMSQDDEIDADCFEKLLAKARDNGADVVIPNMLLKNEDGSLYTWNCSYPPNHNYSLTMDGKEAFFLSCDFSINGFALIRKPLFVNGFYYTDNYDSDEYNTRLQYLHAKKICFADTTFYYFQGNPHAVTKLFSPKRFGRLISSVNLADQFERIFTEHTRRVKLKIHLMKTYIDILILYFWHRQQLTEKEDKEVREIFKTFEQKVHFTRYRKEVWYGLNYYERFFAIPYFVFGSSLGVLPIYSFIHRIRKGR